QEGEVRSDGVVAYKDQKAEEDSTVVANWRRAGAVILGRTNTPAFSSRWDTDNDLYGRSWNPWSRQRTAGGSSGGAAAAVACGIGRGGSIRYPAYCCGVAGIRPTMGRVPSYNPSVAQESPPVAQLISVNGLLARRVADLRLGLRPLAEGDARDPNWVPAPLEGPPVQRPIRVALLTTAPGLFVHPAIEASLRAAAGALSETGYVVEEPETPSIEAAAVLWARLGAADSRSLGWPTMEKLADDGVKPVNSFFIQASPALDLPGYQPALAAVRAHP